MYAQRAYETVRDAVVGVRVRQEHKFRGSAEVELQYGLVIIPKDSVFYVPNSDYLIYNAISQDGYYLSVHTTRHIVKPVRKLFNGFSNIVVLFRGDNTKMLDLESVIDNGQSVRLPLKREHLAHLNSKRNGKLRLIGGIDHFQVWMPNSIDHRIEVDPVTDYDAAIALE